MVARAPDYRLNWRPHGVTDEPLILSARSNGDTTLVICTDEGMWGQSYMKLPRSVSA